MSVLQAVIMGIIQGLTEFLPVSSSGHLAMMKNILGVDTETGILFDILLHVATLISIFLVMYTDIIRLIREFFGIIRDVFINIATFFSNLFSKNKKEYLILGSSPMRKFVIMLIISTIPTGILGYLMKDIVENAGTTLLVPGICLLGTGAILLLSDMFECGRKTPKDANYGDSFVIGTVQGIATLPGLSRSGTTISACLLCGFSRKFAVKYSFIMSMPAILGALLLELMDIGSVHVTGGEVACYILGMVIACVVGFIALHLTIKLVMNRFFKYFGFYCLGIGAIAIVAYIIML